MNAHVVLLASGKGGTGKTTVSAMVGAALAARGLRVLVVEAAPGLRSLDTVCGVYGQIVYDLDDVLTGRCAPEKAITVCPLYPGMSVICAPYAGGRMHAQSFGVLMQNLRPHFDFILLDTVSGMGASFAAACAVSNAALLVVTPDAVAVRDARIVADALFATGHTPVRLVLNKVPPSLENAGVADLDECIDLIGAQLIGVLPFSAELMRIAATGEPLVAQGRVQRAFSAIAARVCGCETPLFYR